MAARSRVVQGLEDYSNAAELSGLFIPCGDGTVEGFDLDLAAAWLVWEAKRRPAAKVVADFAYFLEHRKAEGLKIALIHGLQIATSIQLGPALRLEPFPGLPVSWQANWFAQRRELEHSYDTGRLGEPVALTLRFPISPGLVPPDERKTFEAHEREDIERQSVMDAIVPVFTLLGDIAPVVSGSWSQAAGRGVPSLGQPRLLTGFEDLGVMGFRQHPAPVVETEVKELVQGFLALSDKSRTRLAVPLRHLNRSRRQYTPEAAAIDLRTALEALLVPDRSQEITFKVSLIGAWMLGNDHEQRKRAFDRLRKAYGLGSQAVHGCKIKGGPNAFDLIHEVQSDTAAILKMVISTGDRINPLDIALGKPLHGTSS